MSREIENLVDCKAMVGEMERSGFCLRDLPLPLDLDEARSWLNQLERVFGRGIGHKHAVEGVVSLTNDPKVYTDNTVRPQSDTGHQSPHIDGAFEQYPPRVMTVLCLHPADTGGETLLVDMELPTIGMGETTLRGLYVPNAIRVNRGDQWAEHPVFSNNGRGGTTARFSNHEYNVSFPGNELAAPGFAVIDNFLKDPAHQTTIALKAGQLIVIDNDRVTHGRREFNSHEPRHLLRKWYDGKDGSGNTLVNTGIKKLLIKP